MKSSTLLILLSSVATSAVYGSFNDSIPYYWTQKDSCHPHQKDFCKGKESGLYCDPSNTLDIILCPENVAIPCPKGRFCATPHKVDWGYYCEAPFDPKKFCDESCEGDSRKSGLFCAPKWTGSKYGLWECPSGKEINCPGTNTCQQISRKNAACKKSDCSLTPPYVWGAARGDGAQVAKSVGNSVEASRFIEAVEKPVEVEKLIHVQSVEVEKPAVKAKPLEAKEKARKPQRGSKPSARAQVAGALQFEFPSTGFETGAETGPICLTTTFVTDCTETMITSCYNPCFTTSYFLDCTVHEDITCPGIPTVPISCCGADTKTTTTDTTFFAPTETSVYVSIIVRTDYFTEVVTATVTGPTSIYSTTFYSPTVTEDCSTFISVSSYSTEDFYFTTGVEVTYTVGDPVTAGLLCQGTGVFTPKDPNDCTDAYSVCTSFSYDLECVGTIIPVGGVDPVCTEWAIPAGGSYLAVARK